MAPHMRRCGVVNFVLGIVIFRLVVYCSNAADAARRADALSGQVRHRQTGWSRPDNCVAATSGRGFSIGGLELSDAAQIRPAEAIKYRSSASAAANGKSISNSRSLLRRETAKEGGKNIHAVPEILEPKIFVSGVLIVVVVRDREGNHGRFAGCFKKIDGQAAAGGW